MRFRVSRRVFYLLQASWLVLLLAEPPAIHVCAVHGSSIEHVSIGHSAHHKAPAHEHSAQCSCLGASSHSNPVVISSFDETEFTEARIIVVAAVPTRVFAAPVSPPSLLLPYPNGPPAAIAA
jgi:hypothetical protein